MGSVRRKEVGLLAKLTENDVKMLDAEIDSTHGVGELAC